MTAIFTKIGVGITAAVIAIAGFFGFVPEEDQLMGTAIPQVVALFETSLAVKITSAGTSMTLTSGETKDTTTLSGFYGFIIDEGTASEEFVTASCTVTTCTDLTRGISVITGDTEVAALKKAHRRGGSVKITNHPVLAVMARIMNGDETFPNTLKYASNPSFASSTAIVDKNYCDTTFVGLTGNQTIAGVKYFSSIPTATSTAPTADIELTTKKWIDDNFVNASSTQTIAGIKTFSSFCITPSAAPTTNYQVANKKYIDDIAIAGAADATLTLQGLVEVATTAEINSGAATGTTEASLSIRPDLLADSIYSTSNFVASSSVLFGGDGSDGALSLSGSASSTIDLGSATIVEKNYTSISITDTAYLVFSNPATRGTIVILRSQGDVTLTSNQTPMIDGAGIGAAAANNGIGFVVGTHKGADGTTGAGGGGGTANHTAVVNAWVLSLFTGAGGGTADYAGGRGGGGIYIECNGAFNFTTAGGVSVAGVVGGANGAANKAGGGGGAGGSFTVLYRTLTAKSGTVTIAGGTGGGGGDGGTNLGGAGGDGMTGEGNGGDGGNNVTPGKFGGGGGGSAYSGSNGANGASAADGNAGGGGASGVYLMETIKYLQ